MFSEAANEFDRKDGDGYIYFLADSREIIKTIRDESIDCFITSPPYLDLKNYGGEKQIGYRQSRSDYFSDMRLMFNEMLRCAKEGAALWLVVDSVKKEDGLIMLPFELAQLAVQVGWKVHDFITWDKGKSLPWGHSGKLRGVTEQIILLAKGQLKTFDVDKVRDSVDLSHYWVKYPERYSPHGKSPSNLWHFPIPMQGSWSKKDLRHACPLPEALIKRMLLLTTNVGDTILDPFAGTGSVVSAGSKFKRYAIGIDSSIEYFTRFKIGDDIEEESSLDTEIFSKLIINLRKLKIGIELFKHLSRPDNLNGIAAEGIQKIIVNNTGEMSISIILIAKNKNDIDTISEASQNLLSKPPLSKYGIAVEVHCVDLQTESKFMPSFPIYEYRSGKFYKYHKKVSQRSEVEKGISTYKSKYPIMYSNIELSVTTPADR